MCVMHNAKTLLSGLNGARSDLQRDHQTHTYTHTHGTSHICRNSNLPLCSDDRMSNSKLLMNILENQGTRGRN